MVDDEQRALVREPASAEVREHGEAAQVRDPAPPVDTVEGDGAGALAVELEHEAAALGRIRLALGQLGE